jgi:hypothetical protein
MRQTSAGVAHLGLDRFQRKSAAQHVPRIGRDHAAGANHPHHLGDAFGRIGNEENHQRHNGCIEPVFGEGKRHRVALAELRQACRGSCARESKLPFGRIDALNFSWRASLDQELGEGAVSAANIDPS